MSNRTASAILVATGVPVADFAAFGAALCVVLLGPGLVPLDHAAVRWWVVFRLAAVAWTCGLVVVYGALLFRVARLSWPRKALWMLGLFWVSGVAMPVFWYRHVWPRCSAPGGSG